MQSLRPLRRALSHSILATRAIGRVRNTIVTTRHRFERQLLTQIGHLDIRTLKTRHVRRSNTTQGKGLTFTQLPTRRSYGFPRVLHHRRTQSPSFLIDSMAFSTAYPVSPTPDIVAASPSHAAFEVTTNASSAHYSWVESTPPTDQVTQTDSQPSTPGVNTSPTKCASIDAAAYTSYRDEYAGSSGRSQMHM